MLICNVFDKANNNGWRDILSIEHGDIIFIVKSIIDWILDCGYKIWLVAIVVSCDSEFDFIFWYIFYGDIKGALA